MSEKFRLGTLRLALKTTIEQEYSYESRPGGWIVATRTSDGRRFRFQVLEVKGRLSVAAGGRLYEGQVEQKTREGGAGGGSESDLLSQFPGKVRKLLVTQGQTVEAGQSLLLMEAMKMEFTIRAPYAGEVTQIKVSEGQQVAPGTRFLDLKVAASGGENG